MIGEMRTQALVNALGRESLTSETLVGLLVLAFAVDTSPSAPTNTIPSVVSVIAEGGKLTSDTALIHTTAIKVLQTVLNCRLAYGEGGGLAVRIAGDAICADADLPHMGTEEFLACLSRAALEAEASRHRVLPRGRVKDMFAHAPCWRANSLIQSASYSRSASNIVCGSRALRRTEHSRLSCASPGVRARWTGRPLASTTA
jgi:hypothetical protein